MSDINPQEPTWLYLEKYFKKERGRCYILLAVPGCAEREADMLRGEIRRLTKLIDLPKDPITQPEEVEPDLSYL